MKTVALLFTPLMLFVLAVPALAQEAPKVGDVVWAEWQPNAWFHGRIAKKTDKGFQIDFDDGDTADVDLSQLAPDKEPKKDDVKKGTRVLAKWSDDKFYPGKVAEVKEDGTYAIDFEDGDTGDAELKDIRLICKAAKVVG